jgi:hypothetical protein
MNKLQLIERAVKRFEFEAARRRERDQPRLVPRVVTIARTLGCGGEQIATLLGEVLGCPVWDKEILDFMARDEGDIQTRLLKALDEASRSEIEDVLATLVGHVATSSYMYRLPRAIHLIARSDAIILGRGAHLLLPDAFRVFVTASAGTCLERLMQQTGMGRDGASDWIEQREKQRIGFLDDLRQQLGRRDRALANRVEYDLAINTDRIEPPVAVELIVQAATRHFAQSPARV